MYGHDGVLMHAIASIEQCEAFYKKFKLPAEAVEANDPPADTPLKKGTAWSLLIYNKEDKTFRDKVLDAAKHVNGDWN